MISPEIIKERLKEMDENLKALADLRKMSLSKFRADLTARKAAERCLQISIQCALDICHHIIAANNWPRPQNNQEAFITIGQMGVIPSGLSKHIRPMAGLRNILVHEYIKINPQLVYSHLRHIEDFRKFQKHILAYLKSS